MSISAQSGIYKIIHVASGRYYVGSSKNIRSRWWTHKSLLRANTHGNPRLQNYWNKYGSDAFSLEVVELTGLDRLREREQEILLAEHPFFNIALTVSAIGGATGAQIGHVVTAETRAKISKANKGCKRSLEFRALLAEKARGRIHSPESRIKRSISMIGKNVGKTRPYKPFSWKRNWTHCIHGHELPVELRADGRRKNCALCVKRRCSELRIKKNQQLAA